MTEICESAREHPVLKEFNDTAAVYPKEKSIIDLFEEQAAKTPEVAAIIFKDQQLSYKELNERSNQLANYLIKQGIKAETLVPICIERSAEMLIGILGILKAGGRLCAGLTRHTRLRTVSALYAARYGSKADIEQP